MKKLILLLSSSVLLLSMSGCNLNKDRTTKTCVYQYDENNSRRIPFTFFSKNPKIPYMTAENYQKYIIELIYNLTEYESISKIDDKYVFTNKVTNSKMTFDPKENTATYDNFSLYDSVSEIPHTEIDATGSAFSCQMISDKSSYIKGNSWTIDLDSYGLLAPITQDNVTYFPLDLLFRFDTFLSDSSSFYNGDNKIVYYDGSYPIRIDDVDPFCKSFAEYNYDLFTFDIDQSFGLINYNRPLRCKNNENFKFFEGGARQALSKYKESIINSENQTEFDINFGDMFKNEFPDGGHSGISYVSFFTDTKKLPSYYGYPDEFIETNARFNSEEKAREKASSSQGFNSSVYGFDTDSDGHNDIGYLTIDSFSINPIDFTNSLVWTLASPMGANSAFNKNANEKAEAQYIKDVVIDLSNNGGGSTAAEGILLSWICGGEAKQVLRDAKDGAVTTSVYKYDINGDKVFDEKDYLPNDVNIYILTDATFSAACALTFDAYMYTKTNEYQQSGKNIKFIGKPNLGGSCSVKSNICLPSGLMYQFSSQAVGVYWDDYTKTCDEIMPLTAGWEMTIDQITNRTGYINPKIVEARK